MWCIYEYEYEYYLAIEKNKILCFTMAWMDLESIMQTEISDKDKYQPYDFIYMWNTKKKTNKIEQTNRFRE